MTTTEIADILGTVEKGRVRLLPNRNAINIPDFERFGRSLTLPKFHFIDFFNSPISVRY
jgi:hypothetical protein